MKCVFTAAVCFLTAVISSGCINNQSASYEPSPGYTFNDKTDAAEPVSLKKEDYTDEYTIVADHGKVNRTNGKFDDHITWVVEFNGETVLERNAVDDFQISPAAHGDGRFRVWLKAYIDGEYKPVSNVVEWSVPFDESTQVSPNVTLPEPVINTDYIGEYTLTAENGLVTRTTGAYDNGSLGWVINVNGEKRLERSATGELTYRPDNYGDGIYKVWLTAFINGGYKRVSNEVEWTMPLEGVSAEDAEIIELKRKMKSLIRNIDGTDADNDYHLEYKAGFVIDPDHDGEYNACVYYSGTDKEGNEAQYIFQNGSYWIQFSTIYQRDNGNSYKDNGYLYIWCDETSGKDYIVRCVTEENGDLTAYDCCTGEVIYTKVNGVITLFGQKGVSESIINNGKFYFRSSAPYNCDEFYVSKNGKAELQGA